MRYPVWIVSLLLASGASAESGTFLVRPVFPAVGVTTLSRGEAERLVSRALLGEPAASAVFGEVHLYAAFPFVEGRTVYATSDAGWQRILYGEPGQPPFAYGRGGTAAGEFGEPRGMAFGPDGRLFIADRALGRITVLRLRWIANQPRLEYAGQMDGLVQPMDVAVHDGGTPADTADDRLLVAEAGAQRIALLGLDGDLPVRSAAFGGRGSGTGEFLFPRAIGIGRNAGACDDAIYVSDAGNHRVVVLRLRGERLEWDTSLTLPSEATSIDSDHNGNVYLSMRRNDRILKLSPQLELLAGWDGGPSPLVSPRDVTIPFAWVHDHRTDAAPAWRGEGTALVLEAWGATTGVRRLDLGVELTGVTRRGDGDLEFLLTDTARLSAQVQTNDGRVQEVDLGLRAAGRQQLSLSGWGNAALVHLTAVSEYDPLRRAEASLESAARVPSSLVLQQNVPNPFNPSTRIAFAFAQTGPVRLAVYDVRGRRVRTLIEGVLEAGEHHVDWDGRDRRGQRLGSGIYFYRLDADGGSQVRKMVLAQ